MLGLGISVAFLVRRFLSLSKGFDKLYGLLKNILIFPIRLALFEFEDEENRKIFNIFSIFFEEHSPFLIFKIRCTQGNVQDFLTAVIPLKGRNYDKNEINEKYLNYLLIL